MPAEKLGEKTILGLAKKQVTRKTFKDILEEVRNTVKKTKKLKRKKPKKTGYSEHTGGNKLEKHEKGQTRMKKDQEKSTNTNKRKKLPDDDQK